MTELHSDMGTTFNDDSIIFHYTNTDSLKKIMKGEALWATHLRYMNDPSEIDLGLSSVRYALDHAVEQSYREARQFPAIRQAAESWAEHKFESIDPFEDYFAVCFSTDGDSLSQWRAYGPRRGAGPGVSIGFRLTDLLASDRIIEHVRYVEGIAEGSTLVKNWVDLLDADVGPQPEHGTHGSPFNPARLLWWQQSLAAAFIKDRAFCDEHEVRCIAKASAGRNPNSNGSYRDVLQYRPSNYGLTPYIELALNHAIPQVVIVGPCPHPDLARASIRSFFGIDSATGVPEICSSKVPYRDW